jgi:hypothetical protein
VSPVKYELDFYIPEDDILHSYYRENLKTYITNILSGDFRYSLLMCYDFPQSLPHMTGRDVIVGHDGFDPRSSQFVIREILSLDACQYGPQSFWLLSP